MSEFQELKIKIEAEDNVTKVLDKIKKSLKGVKESLEEINNVDLSKLKDTIKDAFDFKDVKTDLKKDIESVTNIVKKESKKIEDVTRKSNFSNQAGFGTLVSSRKTPVRQAEKITDDANQLDLVEQVYTIIDTYEKIQDGVKTITKVITEYDADTDLETEKEVLYDITDQFEKISKVKSQLPNASDFNLEGFKEIKSTTKELGDTLESVTKKFEKVEDGLKTTVTTIDGKISDITTSTIELKKELEFPKFTRTDLTPITSETKELGNGQVEDIRTYEEIIDNIKTTWKVINGTIRDTKKSTIELNDNTKKANKSASKLGRFFNNIRKIILYRTIRKTLSEIVKAFKEGIQELAKFDKSFNGIMSNIVTSTAKIKAGVALIFEPFINMLSPIIEEISKAFESLANSISKAFASSRGLATYTKINAKYTKDYADSLNEATKNLSFDKFESLGETRNDIYEEVKLTDDETSDTIKEFLGIVKEFEEIIVPTLKSIGNILKDVVVALIPLIKKLLDVLGPILDKIMGLLDTIIEQLIVIIEPIIDAVLTLLEVIDWQTLTGILKDIVYILSSIIQVVLAFVPLKTLLEVIANILNILLVILKPLFDVTKGLWQGTAAILNFINQPFVNAVKNIANILSTIYDVITGKIFTQASSSSTKDTILNIFESLFPFFKSIRNVFGFANGGVIGGGNLLRTNELGTPEWIGKMGHAGAVVNDSQMTDLMYNAVYNAVLDGISNNNNNITIDFTGINGNNLARELAKPMANQFLKQNIKVRGV